MSLLKNSKDLQENTCTRVSSLTKLKAGGLKHYLQETPTQTFSCEFCEVFKNTYLVEQLLLYFNEQFQNNLSKYFQSYIHVTVLMVCIRFNTFFYFPRHLSLIFSNQHYKLNSRNYQHKILKNFVSKKLTYI